MNRPTIIIICIGHSGSTPVAKAIQLLGWYYGQQEPKWDRRMEVGKISQMHMDVLSNGQGLSREQSAVYYRCWCRLPIGCIVKCPRFCQVMHLFREDILDEYHGHDPVLFWLERDLDAVKRSFSRRGEWEFRNGSQIEGIFGNTVDEMHEMCRQGYGDWPRRKKIIQYEGIIESVAEGSQNRFLKELCVEEWGPFSQESTELAMSIIDPEVPEVDHPLRDSSWDPLGRMSR